ncbi:hypothetical protein [Parablautia intestinalis]|nr:hypothetical protein [Parablautia intestinalis]
MSKKLKRELAFFLNDRGRRRGTEDSNGILFIRVPVIHASSRSGFWMNTWCVL